MVVLNIMSSSLCLSLASTSKYTVTMVMSEDLIEKWLHTWQTLMLQFSWFIGHWGVAASGERGYGPRACEIAVGSPPMYNWASAELTKLFYLSGDRGKGFFHVIRFFFFS